MTEIAAYDRYLALKAARYYLNEGPWIKGHMYGPNGSCCAVGFLDRGAIAVFPEDTIKACELFDQVLTDVELVLPDLYKKMDVARLSSYNDTAGREKAEIRQLFSRAMQVLEVRLGRYRYDD